MEKLALYGGTPVRETPFFKGWPGIQEYGLEEAENLIKVIKARSPFRYYGPDIQNMVKNFEAAMRERFGVTDIRAEFIGPVIGSHTGMGTLGLFFRGEHK